MEAEFNLQTTDRSISNMIHEIREKLDSEIALTDSFRVEIHNLKQELYNKHKELLERKSQDDQSEVLFMKKVKFPHILCFYILSLCSDCMKRPRISMRRFPDCQMN